MKKADIGVALYLLAAVIFFIVPISSTLLDVMIAINISIALIILYIIREGSTGYVFLPDSFTVHDYF